MVTYLNILLSFCILATFELHVVCMAKSRKGIRNDPQHIYYIHTFTYLLLILTVIFKTLQMYIQHGQVVIDLFIFFCTVF